MTVGTVVVALDAEVLAEQNDAFGVLVLFGADRFR